MKKTQIIMGMPISVEIAEKQIPSSVFDKIFSYFKYIDKNFSPYKKNSLVSKINRGELKKSQYTKELLEIIALCNKAKRKTKGYFDPFKKGYFDPSGLVKSWSIYNAYKLVKKMGYKNFYIDAGGDMQISGEKNERLWRIGIRNPFEQSKIVKKLKLSDRGIATSGNYIRGDHIYNPHTYEKILDVVSLTVIGPNVLDADIFATAAFAMGKRGIHFIEKLKDFEGYIIDNKGIATYTSGFEHYVK